MRHNPFASNFLILNPSTTISYGVPQKGHVRLDVYNILGRRVTTLIDKTVSAGNYTVEWDAKDFASGMYFYRMTSGKTTISRKMIMLK